MKLLHPSAQKVAESARELGLAVEIVEFEQALPNTGANVPQTFEYPMHADGEMGDPKTSEFVNINNALVATETLHRRAKLIQPNVGFGVNAKTISIKSKRKIVKNFDFKVRG